MYIGGFTSPHPTNNEYNIHYVYDYAMPNICGKIVNYI